MRYTQCSSMRRGHPAPGPLRGTGQFLLLKGTHVNKKVSTLAFSKLQGTHSPVYLAEMFLEAQGHQALLHTLSTAQHTKGTFTQTGVLPRARRCTTHTVLPGSHGHRESLCL